MRCGRVAACEERGSGFGCECDGVPKQKRDAKAQTVLLSRKTTAETWLLEHELGGGECEADAPDGLAADTDWVDERRGMGVDKRHRGGADDRRVGVAEIRHWDFCGLGNAPSRPFLEESDPG